MSIPAFTASEWFNHTLGREAVIASWPGKTLGDARALKGSQAIIDGALYDVIGVESFALGDEASARNFGLLVSAPVAHSPT